MSPTQHIVPVKTYVLVFLALMVLLALTVAAAQIEHGALNLIVGMTIAAMKATLIVMFFMHVKYNPFVIRLAVVAGLLWFAILVTLTMSDYLTRTQQAGIESTLPRQTYQSLKPLILGNRNVGDSAVVSSIRLR